MAFAERNAEAVEEQLPCGDRGERQGSGFGEGERARFVAGQAFIDDMELTVGAGAGNGSGVEDFIAGLEERNIAADRLDDAGAIVAENFGLRLTSLLAHADLGVHRIDGDGADGDEEIAGRGWAWGVRNRREIWDRMGVRTGCTQWLS